jgi:hypothetical protein
VVSNTGNESAAIRKIDVNVTEVGFEPLSGIVVERDKRLTLGASFGQQVQECGRAARIGRGIPPDVRSNDLGRWWPPRTAL